LLIEEMRIAERLPANIQKAASQPSAWPIAARDAD
jgi:hypothetical protein